MEDFFKAEGLSRIIFYFQEDENLPDAGTVHELIEGGGGGDSLKVELSDPSELQSLPLLTGAVNGL